jgi:hypothetical protein
MKGKYISNLKETFLSIKSKVSESKLRADLIQEKMREDKK